MQSSLLQGALVAALSLGLFGCGDAGDAADATEMSSAATDIGPTLSPGGAHSFHIVVQGTPAKWDSIPGLNDGNGPLITSDNPPTDPALRARWAQKISAWARTSPTREAKSVDVLYGEIVRALNAGAQRVMVDELASNSRATLAAVFQRLDHLQSTRPDIRGRWGAFVAHHTTLSGLPEIFDLLAADAEIALEMYPRQSEYCARGGDSYLSSYLLTTLGELVQKKLNYPVRPGTAARSRSHISVVLGVTDAFGGADPNGLIDRAMFVLDNSPYSAVTKHTNGGFGAYAWDNAVSDDARDASFAASYNYYARHTGGQRARSGVSCAAPPPPPPPPPPPCGVLVAGQGLAAGQSISSCGGVYTLVMQYDGNLVLYHNGVGYLWATFTNGRPANLAILQGDGNFVVYDASLRPWWNSRTNGHPGAFLAVQDDGNLVLYGPKGLALWNTGTNGR